MNASEKKILKLAIILFIIGLVIRYLPWGLPSIEAFEVGNAIVVANTHADSVQGASERGRLERDISENAIASADSSMVVDKLKNIADSEGKSFKHRRLAKKKVEFPLRINVASAEDLCAIKGVGPKLAEKIIERRNSAGPFKGPSDLKKVRGIGKKKLDSMLQLIIFD